MKTAVWDIWSAWSSCNATCNSGRSSFGIKFRGRSCLNFKYGSCTGPSIENENCEISDCYNWSNWSGCSRLCDGEKYRTFGNSTIERA